MQLGFPFKNSTSGGGLYFDSLAAQTFCTEFRVAGSKSSSSQMKLHIFNQIATDLFLAQLGHYYMLIKIFKLKSSFDKSWADIN